MRISLKNHKAERLARQVTDAIIRGLWQRLERLRGRRSVPDLREVLMAFSRRCGSLPDLDTRSADEILGYDGKGTFG